MPIIKVREDGPLDVVLYYFRRSCEEAGILAEVCRCEFYEKLVTEHKYAKVSVVKHHTKKLAHENARRTCLY